MSKPQKRRHLSNKELEILEFMVTNELTTQEIAEKMCLTTSAIHAHQASIRKLYGTSDITIAVIRYMKERFSLGEFTKSK